ncbi:MAG: cysteine synthase A, partial [Promethearchaeota archaeon]
GLPDELKPTILDSSVIDEICDVSDDDAYRTGIKLARKNGILVGPSTGAILSVALEYAKDHEGLAVIIAPDDALKYVSNYASYVENESNPIF